MNRSGNARKYINTVYAMQGTNQAGGLDRVEEISCDSAICGVWQVAD